MRFYEAMLIVKNEPTKRIIKGERIFGYAPRFDQFYEMEYERSVYLESISTRLLFDVGWKVVSA